MKVLVTGHEGYLGAVIVPALQQAGHEVIGLDIGLFNECVLGPHPLPIPVTRVDVRDVTWQDCRAEAVIHLAALSNDPLGNIDPQLTMDINHQGTVRLARAAKTNGVQRFLFASSCALYGKGSGGQLLTEQGQLDPITAYAESKIRCERDLLELADEEFSPVFLRNATAYGYSPRLRTDIAVNDLTASALLTGNVRLRSDGSAFRAFVHVEDIAAAFVALLEAPRTTVHAKAYNVGSTAENYRISDLAQIVAEMVPGSSVTFAPGHTRDRRDYRVSFDRIAAEVPAFRPRWTVREGVAELVDAYRRYGLVLEDLMTERYHRLSHIKRMRTEGRLDPSLRRMGDDVPAT